MDEKEPQSAKKQVWAQADELRKVMWEHDGVKMELSDPSPSVLSLSVSMLHIPPAGPVSLFSSLGNFFFHRICRLPK